MHASVQCCVPILWLLVPSFNNVTITAQALSSVRQTWLYTPESSKKYFDYRTVEDNFYFKSPETQENMDRRCLWMMAIHKFSTLGSGGRGYYELHAVRNKTLCLELYNGWCSAGLTLYIENSYHGEVMLLCGSIWKMCCESLHHDLIMLQLLSCFLLI